MYALLMRYVLSCAIFQRGSEKLNHTLREFDVVRQRVLCESCDQTNLSADCSDWRDSIESNHTLTAACCRGSERFK